jgi:hypothetical protein
MPVDRWLAGGEGGKLEVDVENFSTFDILVSRHFQAGIGFCIA